MCSVEMFFLFYFLSPAVLMWSLLIFVASGGSAEGVGGPDCQCHQRLSMFVCKIC